MSRGVTVCNERGCPELVGAGANRCPAHTRDAWTGSTRRARLPKDWARIRARVLRRDRYQCQAPGCSARATDVDHIVNDDNHSESNLQALCAPHHKAKTARESARARRRVG